MIWLGVCVFLHVEIWNRDTQSRSSEEEGEVNDPLLHSILRKSEKEKTKSFVSRIRNAASRSFYKPDWVEESFTAKNIESTEKLVLSLPTTIEKKDAIETMQ
jgi:hypothetical protein